MLPTQLTSFIGRHAELTELGDLLAARRLVTITGAGGCGKTRLAIEALDRHCDRWPEGARWVDLGSVTDPDRVPEVVAAAVGALADPAGGAQRALTAHVRDRELVVCLDNCEHLLEACAELVDALLRACPAVTVLATSREPLGVAGETVWRVPSMVEDEAVELFADRARWVDPKFVTDASNEEAVRTVCRRLDGIPLAVELAAAWVRMLTPAQISTALDDRFRLLVNGPRGTVPRQQTLAASVDWSYGLLRDEARTLLRRVAVFSGGFTLEAAEAVAAAGTLAADDVLGLLGRLVDASIVWVGERSDGVRYRLPETIRQYAADRLSEAGESAATRDRHLAYYLRLAEAAAAALDHDDQDVVLAQLEREHDNLRTAVAWGLSRPDPEPGRRLAAALCRLWMVHGHAHEGIEVLQRAVEVAPDDRSTLQVELLSGLGLLGMPAGRFAMTEERSRQAIELAEETGDDRALARAYASSLYVSFLGDYERAEERAQRAQHHGAAAGDLFACDYGQLVEAASLMNRDRNDEADALMRDLYERALPRNDRLCASFALSIRMHAAVLGGDVHGGLAMAEEAVRLAEPLNDYFILGTNMVNLAWARGVSGDVAEGRRLIESVARSVGDAGPDVDVLGMAMNWGKLLLWDGDLDRALEQLERALGYGRPISDNWMTIRALPALADALRRLGRVEEARERAEQGVARGRKLGTPHVVAESLEQLGFLAAADDPSRALALHHEALALRVEHGVRIFVVDSLDAIAALAAEAGSCAEAARLLAASEAARREMGNPRPAIDRDRHEALVAAVRGGLGDEAFAAAEREGAALSLDDAVAYATRARGARQRPPTGWASLTPTEQQVVALVVEGLTNPGIAERMFVSRDTVKTHLSHIYAKLGVANRTELAALAIARQATA
ncbi:MAG TPA: LuxR C-terminal-related transcriptional regulator [Acidimicrobiales bacterium]